MKTTDSNTGVNNPDSNKGSQKVVKQPGFFARLYEKVMAFYEYCWSGIWKESSSTTKIRLIKVANLSVRSFLDRDLQTKSMSLTYSTVLAIVPAIALLLAIGRGFGLQDVLEQNLYHSFPAQKQIITFSLSFVDSYLKEVSSGVFVGVGIIFLLWTLISLLSNIESAFNSIWGVTRDRSFFQKVTDYIAICLMVPILLICSSGVSIFLSATTQDNLHFQFLTPLVNVVLEALPVVFAWLAFSLSFCLIPYTRVQFRYAAISGAICAVIFQILQLLFVNGTIYVSRYNAIYGSFAFLPLLLIWLQLSWLILLLGCVLTYSFQNIYVFNFIGNLKKMSHTYKQKVTIIVAAVIARRFHEGLPPINRPGLSRDYGLPIRVVERVCDCLHTAGIINYVVPDKDEEYGLTPAVETDTMTIGELIRRVNAVGDHGFIPSFDKDYRDAVTEIDSWLAVCYDSLDTHKILDVPLPEMADDTVKPTSAPI